MIKQLVTRRFVTMYVGRSIKINRKLDTQVAYTKEGDPTLKIMLPGISSRRSGLLENFLCRRTLAGAVPFTFRSVITNTDVLHRPSENIHKGSNHD